MRIQISDEQVLVYIEVAISHARGTATSSDLREALTRAKSHIQGSGHVPDSQLVDYMLARGRQIALAG
jgi:rhodanese-related sulfurtransferase